MKFTLSRLALAAAFFILAGAGSASAQCSDPWINQAFGAIGRRPNGSGNSGECAVGRYGGATWGKYGSNAYNTLLTWVRNSWACSDPWIGQAYATEVGRPVNGSGNGGECSPSLYGSWSSFPDLATRIKAYLARPKPNPTPTPAPPPAPTLPRATTPSGPNPGDVSSACQMMYGRACDINDQAAISHNPAGWTNRDSIMNILRTQVVAPSASIRDSIVNNAVALVYGQNVNVCSEAWTYLRGSFSPNTNSVPPGNWNSFQQLYYAMNGQPAMLKFVVDYKCKGAAPRQPGTAFDTAAAGAACQQMLGRACDASEMAQIGSQVGGDNRDAMQNFIRDRWIGPSASYKDNVIAKAFSAAVPGKQMCTEELTDLRARFFTNPTPGVTWNGYTNLATAVNGQPPLVQSRFSLCTAAVKMVRDSSTIFSMIVNSYPPDFGRDATQAEKDYWASQRSDDPRVASRAAVQQNDRQFIRGTASERQRMITQSYNAVMKRNPTADEMTFWDRQLQSSGMTYEELLASHADFLKKNPPPPPVDAAARRNLINQAYTVAFGRAATPAEMGYWLPLPANEPRLASQQALIAEHRKYLKTDVTTRRAMITASYMAVFRRAPYAGEMTYWDKQVAQTGADYEEMLGYHSRFLADEKKELCFGAVGKGCEGGGISFYDGRSDLAPFMSVGCSPANGGARNCWVAPGSIKHDNCCHQNPNGKQCGGVGPETAMCSNEWEMAVSDVLNHRLWIQTVPDGPSDLTPAPTTRVQTHGERRSSTVLCAPGGTLISDYHGPQFCCSQQFTPMLYKNDAAWGTAKQWQVCTTSPADVFAGGQGPNGLPFGLNLPAPTPAEIQKIRR